MSWPKIGPAGCAEPGCERKHCARGLCELHYRRAMRSGNPPDRIRVAGICDVDGCGDRAYSRMRCRGHYDDARRSGEFTQPCSVSGCGLGATSRGMCGGHVARARRYGMTADDLESLESITVCELCGIRPPGHVDHDHETGKVRGYLCGVCNKGLGHFRDSVPMLKKAIKYLEKSNNQ